MKITMPVAITAADAESRIIAGRIVSWNAEGNTSAGRTMFKPDSITMSKNTKLVLQHDTTRPLGKLVSYEQDAEGITAEFKIAKTTAGNDALEEAATGLRSDFSVGVDVESWDNKDGVMAISSSNLIEVSLVTDGAIPGAEVAKVAAEDTEVSETSQEETQSTTEGEQVSDTTVPAPAEETVEAAKVQTVEATRPAFYTSPRLEFTKAKYLEASIRAKVLGDDESRQYVLAADDTTSNNSGLIPTRQLTEIINPLSNADRGFIDAISRGVLPDAGMTFEIPKITAVPTVGVEAEEATIDETGMTSSFVTVNVKKYAGGQEFSVELLDRSSPAFFDELVRQMEFAYAKATDLDVTAQIALATNPSDYTAQTADGLVKYCALTSAQIYDASLGFAQNLVVSPTQWGNIMGYAESSGRPIFNATNPSNAAGAVGPQSLRGNVAGLNLYVSRSIGVAANTSAANLASLFTVNPDSFTWYESSRFRLQTDVVATGQIKVAYYGYGALAAKVVNGIRHNNTIGA